MRFIAALVLIAGVAILVFQNCAPENLSDEVEDLSTSDPFGYNAHFDKVAYLSCEGISQNYDPKTYFTFGIGAFGSSSGITISSEFWAQYSGLNAKDKFSLIQKSNVNKNAVMQLTLRSPSYLQNGVYGNSSLLENYDYDNIWSSLSGDLGSEVMKLNPSQRLRYYVSSQQDLVGSISFAKYYHGVSQGLREQLASRSLLLALSFRAGFTSQSPVQAITYKDAGGDGNGIFGSALVLDFDVPNYDPNNKFDSRYPKRILKTAKSFDLKTGQVSSASWDCPISYQFKVVPKPFQGSTSGCQINDFLTDSSSLTDPFEIDRFENVQKLIGTSWQINVKQNCVTPEGDQYACYNYNTQIRWGSSSSCEYSPYQDYSCIHFLSICLRN